MSPLALLPLLLSSMAFVGQGEAIPTPAGSLPSAEEGGSAEPPAKAWTFPASLSDDSTGTRFPSEVRVAGTRYRCLGAGVRKVLFFKAYAVTFCVDDARVGEILGSYLQSSHADLRGPELEKALRSDQRFFDHLSSRKGDKLVVMQLVRDISKDRIAGAFRDSLGEVLPRESVERLIATIPGDGKEGQKILLHSHGNQLTIDIAGDAKKIDDPLIAENLWKVWLGPDAVAPSLKDSIAKIASQAR